MGRLIASLGAHDIYLDRKLADLVLRIDAEGNRHLNNRTAAAIFGAEPHDAMYSQRLRDVVIPLDLWPRAVPMDVEQILRRVSDLNDYAEEFPEVFAQREREALDAGIQRAEIRLMEARQILEVYTYRLVAS